MIEIIPVPAFADNYIWLLRRGHNVAVVDPGDAEPVLAHLRTHGLTLVAILNTHHHADHVGGNTALLARFSVPVFGPEREAIPGVTQRLREGENILLPGVDLACVAMDVPGHTAGHIAYFGAGVVFCGDTLFACGCGRLFEGTPAQMHVSLAKLAALPGDTRVYCAHEYTLANIRFARTVEPDNAVLQGRESQERAKREQGLPTVPSTVALECATNPFLRCGEPSIVAAAQEHAGRALNDPVEVFATLRTWKNNF
jgi:hydroxyacylglutathione hydrolase